MSVFDYIPSAPGLEWQTGTPPEKARNVLALLRCKSPVCKYVLCTGQFFDGQFWPEGCEPRPLKRVAYWAYPPDTAPDGGKII